MDFDVRHCDTPQEKAAEVNSPCTATVEESDPFAIFPKPEDNFQASVPCISQSQCVDSVHPICRQQ